MILIYIAALLITAGFLLRALFRKLSASMAHKIKTDVSRNKKQSMWDRAVRVTIPAHIVYADEKSETTEREITIYFIYPEDGDDMLFRALCGLRDDFRHFKCSRVIQFTDRETGEIVLDVKEYLLRKASIAA